MNEAHVQLSHISFRYQTDGLPVLSDFSLEVSKGELVLLTAPSGSGKTTLSHLLSGELKPDEGTIRVGSYHVNSLKGNRLAEYRRHAGFVFQQSRLLSEKTIADNIGFALEIDRVSRSRRESSIAAVLDRFQLSTLAARFPHEVSVGERQRASLVRAVVREPLVLVADEPTAMLSESEEQAILQMFTRENQRGMTILILTNRASVGQHLPTARRIELPAPSAR